MAERGEDRNNWACFLCATKRMGSPDQLSLSPIVGLSTAYYLDFGKQRVSNSAWRSRSTRQRQSYSHLPLVLKNKTRERNRYQAMRTGD